MTKSIFISRKLKESSPLRLLAKNCDATIQDQSLIQFEKVEFEPPTTNWLFFYSKTGVKYFYKNPDVHQLNYQILCFGPATSAYCQNFAPVFDSGNGTVKSAFSKVEEHINDKSITFICGRNSLRSVQILMSNKTFEEVVVYNNIPNSKISPGVFDIAMFTSPMNARTFLSNGGNAKKFVAIGETTAKALRTLNKSVLVADSPSEEGLADALDELLNNEVI